MVVHLRKLNHHPYLQVSSSDQMMCFFLLSSVYSLDGIVVFGILFICTCAYLKKVPRLNSWLLSEKKGVWGVFYKGKPSVNQALISIYVIEEWDINTGFVFLTTAKKPCYSFIIVWSREVHLLLLLIYWLFSPSFPHSISPSICPSLPYLYPSHLSLSLAPPFSLPLLSSLVSFTLSLPLSFVSQLQWLGLDSTMLWR